MTPAALWMQHRTHVAELDDDPVYAALTTELDTDTSLTITRTAAGTRPQGLVLDTDRPCRVGDVEATTLVLWSDTAPAEVTVVVPAGRLTISHVWRDGEIVHAWTGWCGIRRTHDTSDDRWHLVASDGHADLTTDLDVEIVFVPD